MKDSDIVARINELAEAENRLEQAASHGPLSEEDRASLRAVEIALDQCWDLLRQRRARRSAGLDPDVTSVRPPSVVEEYEQ